MILRNSMLGLGALMITLSAAASKSTQTANDPTEQVRERFDLYNRTQGANNAAAADLYSDNAKVRVIRRYPDGQQRQTDYSGQKWKSLIRSAATTPKAQEQYEVGKFSKVQTEQSGQFVIVRAERFNTRRCAHDENYYQVWGKRDDGTWLIVQEMVTNLAISLCQPTSTKKDQSTSARSM